MKCTIVLAWHSKLQPRDTPGPVQLKLGAPVLLPNAQIGCFGAITQLKSMARSRADLFDVAAAGPAAGAAVSAVLFTAGLIFSKSSPAVSPHPSSPCVNSTEGGEPQFVVRSRLPQGLERP